MGQANRAPKSNHRRRYYIADKAVLSCRQLMADKVGASDERDIRNRIDEAVGLGYHKRRVFSFKGESQDAVDLDHGIFEGQNLMAVVAKNNSPNSPFELAVVTITTRSHMARVDSDRPVGRGALSTKLAIAGITRDSAPPAPEPTGEPVVRKGSLSNDKPTPIMSGKPIEEWLISYTEPGEGITFDRVAAQNVRGYIQDLVAQDDVDPDTIEVWKPVKAKAKTRKVVDVEIED